MAFGLVADFISETKEGKLNILGEFNTIRSPTEPIQHHSMFVIARFLASASEGTNHQLQVLLVDEDGQEVIPKSENIQLRFQPTGKGLPLRAHVVLHFTPITLPRFGRYSFHYLLNRHLVGEVEFSCLKVDS